MSQSLADRYVKLSWWTQTAGSSRTDIAVLLAVQAGELVLAQSDRPNRIRTKISGRDLVSDTDLAVERLLVESITAGRPDDAVLTEGDRHPLREWTGSLAA